MTEPTPAAAETSTAAPDAGAADQRIESLREQTRAQMLNSIGGMSGVIIAAVPTVVFVLVNARWELREAIYAAVGSALALSVYRLVRRQPVQQALSGLFGVVIAAVIAARTGQAKGFFLYGIWLSFIYGGTLLLSVVVRRPLAGLVWEFVDPTPQSPPGPPSVESGPTDTTDDGSPAGEAQGEGDGVVVAWYRRPVLMRAYMLSTAALATVFLVRGIVQATLFQHNATGWLAAAKIGLGFPPYVAALALSVWLVRRARVKLGVNTDAQSD